MLFRARVLAIASSLLFLLSQSQADTYRILNAGSEALQARIDLIQQAKISIDLCYYTWSDDQMGRELLGLLREAALKRQVKIRIIVDSKHDHIPPATRAYFDGLGIPILDYNPFQITRPTTWIHSMHNKLMIVDHQILVMGGRNMDGGYFELAGTKMFHDRDAIMSGTASSEAQIYFNDLWESPLVLARIGSLDEETLDASKESIDEALSILSTDSSFKLNTHTDWLKDQPARSEVHFLHDALTAKKEERPVRDGLLQLATQAKSSLVIEVAYLMITRELMQTLEVAVARGVKVRILTNSLQSNDVLIAQGGYYSSRKKLIRMGVELYEYMSDTTLHIKSAVVDDQVAIIGSYNLDPISKNLNSETVSYLFDSSSAQELRLAMDENLKFAVRVDAHGHLQNFQGEKLKRKFPGQPWLKVLSSQLFRYLLVAPLHWMK